MGKQEEKKSSSLFKDLLLRGHDVLPTGPGGQQSVSTLGPASCPLLSPLTAGIHQTGTQTHQYHFLGAGPGEPVLLVSPPRSQQQLLLYLTRFHRLLVLYCALGLLGTGLF